MVSLLDMVQQFSALSGIRLKVPECKTIAYIHALQPITRKRDRANALRARLPHVTLANYALGSLAHDEPLP